ncbi:MAG: hypothetical protein RIT45_123 [Pseudomonadota bacterium]|jgi:serine/threonine-protein kinase
MAFDVFAGMDDELPVASLVDNMYRIVRMVGRGGMGAVYEAEDIRLGRSVALKVLRSDLARQLQADERFLQEARILARLRSPFVATVYSIGATDNGKTYIAMEFIDGESLGDLLDRERWLQVRRSVLIAKRVCEALVEAHENGIVHRDLKPDNILLTRIGSVDDYVKVVDLGLAKHIQSAGSHANPRLTQARLVLGTPAYMSPEQAAGHDVGPASDLYALGVIFYEMMTGFLPVDGETPQDFLRAHQLQPPVPLAHRRPDLAFPAELEAFVQRILAKDPKARPQDARSFLQELEQFEHASAQRRTTRAQPAATRTTRRPSHIATMIEGLEERLDRARERGRLELTGVVSRSRGALYEAIDAFSLGLLDRAEPPEMVRLRIPPPDDRVPGAALFDDVRVRAGVFDDDPPPLSRRKLLAWSQGILPDQPGRASQVAHLLGMFLGVEFPDSPHLSHARAVPEVARMAAGSALGDALRAVAGRASLVLVLERVEFLTPSERSFLRRLLRQLGATSVLVIVAWVGPQDEAPSDLGDLLTAGSVLRVTGPEVPASDALAEPELRTVLGAAIRLGTPLWPGLLAAAAGRRVDAELDRLASAGALRLQPGSRISDEAEYMLGEFPTTIAEEAAELELDLDRAVEWLSARSGHRPRLWARRIAHLEAASGQLAAAARNMRHAGELAYELGAIEEANDVFEGAVRLANEMQAAGDGASAAVTRAEASLGLVRGLLDRRAWDEAAECARDAIESLRSLDALDEDVWFRLGAPLLSSWATAEIRCGLSAEVVEPLNRQIEAIEQSGLAMAMARLPNLRLALGKALDAAGRHEDAVEAWMTALTELPVEPDFPLTADLSMAIAEGHRKAGRGDAAVYHARKALASARHARDLVREAEALRALALSLRDIGELDDAEAQLGEALNALGRVDRAALAADISVLLSEVLMARGAADEADAALAKACRSLAALTDLRGLSDALRKRGEIQMSHGAWQRALAFAEESARQAVLANEVRLQARAFLLSARAAAATGDADASHRCLENAFHLVGGDGLERERIECVVTLADLIEAEVLTSERTVLSLLEEAAALAETASAQPQLDALSLRIKAMRAVA